MTKTRKALVAAVCLVAMVPGSALAANKLIVKGTDGTTDKFVVTDGGLIGLGTSSPSYPLHIKGAGNTGTTTIEFHNQGNTTYGAYDSPAFQLMRNNNPAATGGNGSSIPKDGDRLGNFAFGSYLGTTPIAKYSAFISAFAEGAWSATSYPGYLSLQTAPANTAYPAERVRITSTGKVGIGTSTPAQQLEVNGGVRLNTSTAKPACDSTSGPTNRGTLWFTKGGTSVADTLEVCAKDAAGNYAWKPLF